MKSLARPDCFNGPYLLAEAFLGPVRALWPTKRHAAEPTLSLHRNDAHERRQVENAPSQGRAVV